MSRYNAQRQCAACGRGTAAKVDGSFWELPEVAAALQRWDLGAVVRSYRRHTGLSQAAVARLVSIDQAEVSRLENGKKAIRDRHQLRQWAAGLGIPDQLIAALPTALPSLGRSETFGRDSEASLPGWDDPATIASQLSAITAVNVDLAHLERLEHSIDVLVSSYEASGPQALAPVGSKLRASVHDLLAGRQHPRQRQSLYVLAARAAGLLGYMAVNAGRPASAKAYLTEAYELADVVQDAELMAWVRGTQSLEAYYAGRYQEANDLAEVGVHVAPASPQAIRLLVNGQARALGKINDRQGAERAVGQALILAERIGTPPGLTPCISFEPYGMARILANATTAYLALGDTPKVVSYAEQIDHYVHEADSAWSRALITLDVAASHLQRSNPDVERAMELGRAALRSGEANPIRSVVQRAHELRSLAEPWSGLDAVVEYAAELAQWRAEKAAYVIEAVSSDSAARTP
ncbi:helix-turn-helix domain-containing protein [Kitasatospora sp. NPDC001175]|uniref:helix-turn-helix domain-containing protein n=1 Tax=Kitasatospora sp. NPDC001175 TaxID=3157103 RepID=UPI003CFF2B25